MDKRGQGGLTSGRIVALVLTIAGFVALLSIFAIFKPGQQSEKELCKLSVLTRATSEAVQAYVPLACSTQKICLTDGSGSGKCDPYFIGEKPEKIDVSRTSRVAADKVEEVLANEMFDCWKTKGQGKLSLFNQGLLQYLGVGARKKVACVICSRVAVEHANIGDVWDVNKGGVDINSYLANTTVPGSSLTYLQTFTDEQFKSYASADKINREKLAGLKKTKTFGNSGTNEMAVIFSQIKVEDLEAQLTRIGALGITATAGSFVFGPVAAGVAALVSGEVAVVSILNNYLDRSTAAGFCGKVTTTLNQTAKEGGCSAVQILPYEVSVINEMCGIIEGSP